jgi:hypothetical protein
VRVWRHEPVKELTGPQSAAKWPSQNGTKQGMLYLFTNKFFSAIFLQNLHHKGQYLLFKLINNNWAGNFGRSE